MLKRLSDRRMRFIAAASVRFDIGSRQRLSLQATSTDGAKVGCAA